VYPASFEYFAPTTLDDALSTLGRLGEDGRVLAGGQSLIPVMKLRFAMPGALVDINRIQGLDGLSDEGGALEIGALVRHKTCETSPLLRERYPLLSDAARQISDPIVRNLGTVCGSLAHADPQGDWASAMMAARAEVVARSADGGERTIPIDELIEGPFTTSLRTGEMITKVRVPSPGPRSGGTYLKLERKVGDFATVGVAVQVSLSNGSVGEAGIALTAVGPRNLRATAAEEALRGNAPGDEAIANAARLAAEAAQPVDDHRGTAEYKRNVVRVYVERGLRKAIATAQGGGGNG
jgi:carbon-monoxide dehydrogenase medium subunit